MSRANRNSGLGEALASSAGGLPIVVLVGRANAGKSTLFNRVASRRHAIVSPIPGTTRDVNLARTSYEGRDFVVVDSGGLELGGEALSERVMKEALQAVAIADLVVFLFDGRAGLSAADREAFALVRRLGTPVLAAVNKLDQVTRQDAAAEFYEAGPKRLFPLSAAHGHGVGELLDAIVAGLPAREGAAEPAPDLRVALIGRPNVGKSSLLNRLVGFERALVDQLPGTTRDPIDMRIEADGRQVLLVDTAGIRRRTRVSGELEHHSVGRALESIRRAEVLILVVDATEGITDQDARLARLVESSDRALVVACNKWDAAARLGRKVSAFRRNAQERYPFLQYAPLIFTSALTGDGISGIIPSAAAVGDCFRATFQTARLNRILAEATAALEPPMVERRRLKLLYVTQVGSAPPRLVLFANLERDIPAHYARFLEGRFRAALALSGTPLRLQFRKAQSARTPGKRAAGASQAGRG